jgi:hypothetical protein
MRVLTKRSVLTAVAASSALALSGAGSAGATPAAVNSFDGHCLERGTATYGTNSIMFTGTGTCHGSVNGGARETYHVLNTQSFTGTVFSFGGFNLPGVVSGPGSLMLSGGELKSPVTVTFTCNALALVNDCTGAAGGGAIAVALPTNLAATTAIVYIHTLGAET